MPTERRIHRRPLPGKSSDATSGPRSIVVGSNTAAVDLAAALWRRGFWVPAIRPPTVPQGTARLRVSLTAAHPLADVDALVDALAELSPSSPRATRARARARSAVVRQAVTAAFSAGATAFGSFAAITIASCCCWMSVLM